jgi:hypothetical protein
MPQICPKPDIWMTNFRGERREVEKWCAFVIKLRSDSIEVPCRREPGGLAVHRPQAPYRPAIPASPKAGQLEPNEIRFVFWNRTA